MAKKSVKIKHEHCFKKSLDHAWCENCCYCQKPIKRESKEVKAWVKHLENCKKGKQWGKQ